MGSNVVPVLSPGAALDEANDRLALNPGASVSFDVSQSDLQSTPFF